MRKCWIALLVILCPLGIYMGSYFVLVRSGYGEANLGHYWIEPAYRGFPGEINNSAAWFYKPVHSLDREVLRPTRWEGRQDLMEMWRELVASASRQKANTLMFNEPKK